jgi:nicotinamidase-related amidase
MARTDSRLHGNAPDKSAAALLIIDVINDLEFEDGEKLLEFALPAAKQLRALKLQFRAAKLPVIYANDNFGRWKSDFRAQVKHCLQDGIRGRKLVQLLKPEDQDYFVLKPKHSAFFNTTLDLLLDYLQVETLVIAGVATDICVLFTCSDAFMRDFKIYIPSDCVAANSEHQSKEALALMQRVLKANICTSSQLDLNDLGSSEK